MRELKVEVIECLRKNPLAHSVEAEADRILLHVFSRNRPELDSFGKMVLAAPVATPSEREEALALASARAQGAPLQHLLGFQIFRNHEYEVNASTLIPRPETEILVDAVCARIREQGPTTSLRLGELGLGTGVISLEVLSEFPGAVSWASESSEEAISLARRNSIRVLGAGQEHRLTPLLVMKDQGFEALMDAGPFDWILSNPPYLSTSDEIDPEVLAHEPRGALFPSCGNPDFFYESFLAHRSALLRPGGRACFEIPHERAAPLERLFHAAGARRVLVIPDLTGRPRVLQAEF